MGCELSPSETSGLIAGGSAIVAVIVTFIGEYVLNKWRKDKIIQGVLEALHEELKALWDQLEEEVKGYWEKFEKEKTAGEEPIFSCRLSISQDYLIVYRSNANFIGQIEPEKLRREIVKVYTLLQALMEQYRINTTLLNKCKEADYVLKEAKAGLDYARPEKGYVETEKKRTEFYLKAVTQRGLYSELQGYGPELKKGHDKFGSSKDKLFKMLDEELSKTSNQSPADIISNLRSSNPTT